MVLRLSFVYGPKISGAHATFLQFAEEKLAGGEEFDVFFDEVRSPVYLGDVVASILRLLEPDAPSGTFHLGGPAALSREDFVRKVAEHRGVSCAAMRSVARATCTQPWALAVQSPLDISMASGKLEALLGRRLRSLPEALADMAA